MEERTIRSKKEQKMEKFREILKESEKFKDYSMFRNISKRFLCDQTSLCSFDARSAANSSHDVGIIKSIHQKLRDYQQETHKEIRFVLFNLLDDDGLLRHLKEIEKLCFLYFLMIDYVFGCIHLSKNDNKNVATEIKDSTSNDTFIEIDIELVIVRLINLFNALEEGDFKERKNYSIFFGLIMICNKIVNLKNLGLMDYYLEIKKNKFKISRVYLNARRKNFMFYLGIEPKSSRAYPDPYGTFHKSIDGHFSPHSYQSEIDKLQVEFSKNQSQSTDNLCF